MNEETNTPTARDLLRTATLGSKRPSVQLVEINGQTFEVREPTIKQQKYISDASTDRKTREQDNYKAVVLGVIECTFVPGTDEKVFDAKDMGSLMNRGFANDFVGKLADAVAKLSKPTPKGDDAEENESELQSAIKAAEKNS